MNADRKNILSRPLFIPSTLLRASLHLSSFIFLLSACVPASETASPPTARTEASEVATTPTSTAEPVSGLGVEVESLDGVNVTLWHPWFGTDAALLESLVAQFNSSNEWGIIALTESKFNYAELFSQVTAALPTEARPDIVIGLPEHALYWDAHSASGVLDLERYTADPIFGLADEDFAPVFWNQDVLNGKRFGIPAQRTARFIFYNQSWARVLGFDSAPTTPDEFRERACAAHQSFLSNDTSADDGLGGWLVDTDPYTPLSWMLAFDGGVLEQGNFIFRTPNNLTAFNFVQTLYKDGCSWVSTTAIPSDEFAARHALFISGTLEDVAAQSSAFNTIASADEWTVLPFPGNGEDALVVSGPSYIILPSADSEQLAAWLFVRWILSTENQARWAETTGLFPLRTSSLNLLSSYAASHPQWTQAVQLIPLGQMTPQHADWRLARNILSDGFACIFLGNMPNICDQMPLLLAEMDSAFADVTK